MAIDKRVSRQGCITYRVRVRLCGHGEVSSTHTRLTDARDWEARTKTAMKDGRWQGATVAQRHSVAETIERYLTLLPSLRLKDEQDRRRQLEWWKRELGEITLAELTAAKIASRRDRLQTIPIVAGRASAQARIRYRQPSTVVRYLAALSHALSVAIEDWGWLEANPVKKVRRPKQPRGRVRYLSEPERLRLLTTCRESSSRALYTVVVIAIATGMRKGEIMSLRWSQINFDPGLITLENTKNDDRRQIPLLGYAFDTLKAYSSAPHSAHDYVFPGSRHGRPSTITTAWETAVAKAGIADFRFHDLRHTTASYLAMDGASLLEIGEILGHRSTQMTKRYAHLSVSHTRKVLMRMVSAVWPSIPSQEASDFKPTAKACIE